MIKVYFLDNDKKTVLDVEFYEDNQVNEVLENVQDHGVEYTHIVYNSQDYKERVAQKEVREKLAACIIRAMDEELSIIKAEPQYIPEHQFSKDFESKIAKMIKGA